MMTMKQAFAKAQGRSTVDTAAYDEYYEEMQKKYACERARIYKQKEFKRENAWENIERRVRHAQ